MNKKIVGGVVAVVVIGGGFYANSYMNNKTENAIQQGLAKANQGLKKEGNHISVEKVQCNVLFGNKCVLNNVQVSGSDQPLEIGKMTIGGVRSIAKALEANPSHQGALFADTNVSVKMENMTSNHQSFAEIWKKEDAETYGALTDDIKKSLENNQVYFEVKVNNEVSKSHFTSDELFTLGLADLPLSAKIGLKYTYNGDPSVLGNPQALMKGKSVDPFSLMSNFVVNNLSLNLEQGKHMFTNIMHNVYIDEQKHCERSDNKAQCYKFAHGVFAEPYKSMDHALSEDEFYKALNKSVNDKSSQLYQMVERKGKYLSLTSDEIDRLMTFIVNGGDSLNIDLANKKETPIIGFADVLMSQNPKLLRDKVTITIK